jgi:hypothetical protein
MLPSAFVFLDSIPLTPNGKIDRAALPDPERVRRETETEYIPPRTEIENLIAGVWQEVLRLDRVGIHDNFFEVGGSSLLLVQANARLRERFNRHISMIDMFRYPTVNSMASFLSRDDEEAQVSFRQVAERAQKQADALRSRGRAKSRQWRN